MSDTAHLSLFSPDHRVEVRFMLGDWFAEGRNQADVPLWQVWFGGRQMLRWSRVGVVPAAVDAQSGVVQEKVSRHRIRKSWQPEFGDVETLLDHHNELVVRLREQGAPNRRMDLIFHCSNEGAAVRVRVPRQRGVGRVLPAVGSVFRFPNDTYACPAVGDEPAGGRRAGAPELSRRVGAATNGGSEPLQAPLTLNYAHGKLACLLQLGNAPLRLQPTRDGLAAMSVDMPVEIATPHASSWQVLLLGDKPCDLPQNSGLLLNLGLAASGVATSEARAAERNCMVPFVRYPLWVSDAAGGPGVPSRGHTVPGDGEITPSHRAAFDLICGVGAARWDETRFLRGAIGEFVVVARRLGAVWQVAGITGAEGRVLTVRLEEVLRDGTNGTYILTIDRDPLPNETAAGGFVRETFSGVDCFDKPRMALLPRGGFVLRLEPEASIRCGNRC